MTGRRTGRTTQILARALLAASEGLHVLVFFATHEHARYAGGSAMAYAANPLLGHTQETRYTWRVLGGGTVELAGLTAGFNAFRGVDMRRAAMIADHAVFETPRLCTYWRDMCRFAQCAGAAVL